MQLWNNNDEIQFFKDALSKFASKEQLFYKLKSGYYSYVSKGEKQIIKRYNHEIV